MRKKILSILLAACLIFSLLPVSAMADTAESGSCGYNLTWTLENGVLTISGTGKMDRYGYNSKPDGSGVTSAPWGEYYEAIERVVIENGVTSIGYYAFSGCTSLASIVIPDSVELIGNDAFSGCSSLETVTLGNGLKTIGGNAFKDCTGLKSIVIPDSVEFIYGSFSGCSGLETVTLGTGLKTIGGNAFEYCTGLTSIVIPDGVESIGSKAFYFCDKIETVTLGKGVKTLGSMAFYGCEKVTDVYYTGDISSWLGIKFGFDSKPSNTASRVVNLYFGGQLVTSVVIPNGVTSIGDYAFAGCARIESVTIPDSVTSIGKEAFSYCEGLKTIDIPNSVTTIGEDAFECCTGLKSAKLSDNLNSISDRMFIGCRNLKSVNIPDGVTSIGKEAFDGCKRLTSIDIPDGVTSIGDEAFRYCSSLTSIVIPDSVKSIGNEAFEYCDKLETLTLGKGITDIGRAAFPNSISKMYYTGDINSWLGIKFAINAKPSNCDLYFDGQLVTSIVIPDGVKSIGDYAFSDCDSIVSVTISSSVTSIGYYAFSYCDSIVSVTIPGSVTNIGSGAFKGCSKLTNIVIPNSVTNIGENALGYSIKDIAFGGTADEWDDIGYTFDSGAQSVNVHYNCTTLDGHYVQTEKVEPTCTVDGYIKYRCACGYEYTETLTLEHNYVLVRTEAPTCTAHGYDIYKCTYCGNEKKEYHDDVIKGHNYIDTVIQPTCTSDGYTLHKCSNCGDSYTDTYQYALGHSYGNWTVTTAPTCTARGVETRICTRCNAAQTRDVAALGHSYGNWTQTKAPTCTAKGTEAKTCTRCNASETRDVAPLGHSYKNGTCTRCGAADPNYKPAPKAPELKITTSAGKPKIYWNAVDGAVKYWVYRSTDGKKFSYYDSTKKTSYTNSSTSIGTTYYYKVKAVKTENGKDYASDYSVIRSIQRKPAAPTVSINRSNGKPKLSWKAVSGAKKYWIYRSTDGKNFKYWDSTTMTSYTNSGAASGTKYYYRVKAVAVVNGKNVVSANSSTKSLFTSLAKPSVSITTSNGKPKLTWKAVTGADKYYVYRSTDGKNFSYWDSTTKTTYINSGAKKNTKYYYKVKAVCASNSNANSAQSSAVSIKATK